MLNLFPELLDWSWYVPLVFRLFLGAYVLYIGWMLIQKEGKSGNERDRFTFTCFGVLLLMFGALFVIGLYAQALGSTGFVLAIGALYLRWKKVPQTPESLQFYLLIGLVALSLVFLGAGPYAVDLPL